MEWEKYLNLSVSKLNNNLITLFEKDNDIELPIQYHELIVAYQGMNPKAYLAKVGRAVIEVGPVFHFSNEQSNYKSY